MIRQTMFSLTMLSIVTADSIGRGSAADEIAMDRVFVKRIQQVDIPAKQTGLLQTMSVREGDLVSAGQLIAQLDDRGARLQLKRARAQRKAAAHRAQDESEVLLAKTTSRRESQALKQVTLENKAIHREAENELKIEASEKARDVAKNELERARRARAEYTDSVSQSEIDGLELSFQRASLESQQSRFDRDQLGLQAQASDESIESLALAVTHADVAVKQAKSNQFLNALEAESNAVEVEMAELHLENHQIYSPIDGVVVERFQQEGQWVQSGEPVLRVLRLDRLRVEGYLDIAAVREDLAGRPVRIKIMGLGDKQITVEGKVSFVSPEVDAVNNEVAVWAEFDNSNLQARPGMSGSMTIDLSQPRRNRE